MKRNIIKYLLWGLLILFIGAQFFRIDKTNPPADPASDFLKLNPPPEHLAILIKDACYDCHSNHSEYPWYTNIAPVSWWVKNHINEAREHLNFSTWASYDAEKADHKLEECNEEVANGNMPLKSYTWMHLEAKLTEAQRKELADWFDNLRIASRYQNNETESD